MSLPTDSEDTDSSAERTLVVPFGRYEPTGEAEGLANRVLVGREGPREYLRSILQARRSRAAILVTGQRGVGKTAFVRATIRDYSRDVWGRFLKGESGRTVFWDYPLFLLAGIVLAVLLIASSETLSLLLARAYDTGAGASRVLLLVAAFCFAMVSALPWLGALGAARTLMRAAGTRHGGDSIAGFWMCLSVFCGLLAVPYLYRPAEAISLIPLLVGVLAVSGEVISMARARQLWSRVVLALVVVVPVFIGWKATVATMKEQSEWIEANIYWTLVLIVVFMWLSWYRAAGTIAQENTARVTIANVFTRAARFNLGLGLVAYLGTWIWRPEVMSSRAWIGLPIALCVGIGGASVLLRIFVPRARGSLLKDAEVDDESPASVGILRVGSLYVLKFVALLMMAMHLTFPIVASAVVKFGSVNRIPEGALASASTWEMAQSMSTTLFQAREDLYWVFFSVASIGMITLLEYEWTLKRYESVRTGIPFRPVRLTRDISQAPNTGARLTTEERLQILAEGTIPWALMNAWRPVKTIEINLGVDELTHRDVLQAMLSGLRSSYASTFVHGAAPTRLIWIVATVSLVVVGSSRIGDSVWSGASMVVESDRFRELAATSGAAAETTPNERATEPGVFADRPSRGYCDLSGAQIVEIHALEDPERAAHTVTPGRDSGELPPTVLTLPAAHTAPQVLCALHLDSLVDILIGRVVRLELTTKFTNDEPESGVPLETGEGENEADSLLVVRQFFPNGHEGVVIFRIYHLLSGLVLALIAFRVGRRYSPAPYRQNLAQIDNLLRKLESKTRHGNSSRLQLGPLVIDLSGLEPRNEEIEQEPADSRTVEREVIALIDRLQSEIWQFPFSRDQYVSMPAPELIFHFDELDKVGVGFEPADIAETTTRRRSAERARQIMLHTLLGELKNLLTSTRAKFIFVSGRNLHDEWLADGTARAPLLTSIFDGHVHLPSFLTDGRRRGGRRNVGWSGRRMYDAKSDAWSHRTEDFLAVRWLAANHQYEVWLSQRAHPAAALWVSSLSHAEFLPNSAAYSRVAELVGRQEPPVYCLQALAGETRHEPEVEGQLLRRDLVQFLTYRSLGRPKRLEALLGQLIREVSYVVPGPALRLDKFQACTHVLALGQTERIRIQMIAQLYRQLRDTFGTKLDGRDDKMTTSVLYLADFLLKFHSRAFSWSLLEHVDEAVHIHRAPDLRAVLFEIVRSWSERYLHPILNGMYDFRYRSDVGAELAFVSRVDEFEAAAFNFTLDESQALKSEYESMVSGMGDTATPAAYAGLGDLHEFDEEYEQARFYYNRAIEALDARLMPLHRGSFTPGITEFQPDPALGAVLSNTPGGHENARKHVTWGIARLRLMLQIGMTFERAHNFERALTAYRDARTLAYALLRSYAQLRRLKRGDSLLNASGKLRSPHANRKTDRLDTIKHLTLLFQPGLAEAWVLEKLSGGVDTSAAAVERDLAFYRSILNYVNEPFAARKTEDVAPDDVGHSNFALTLAEIHNKTGDLFYFKGRFHREEAKTQSPQRNGVVPLPTGFGYLVRAHYHYCMGLHELRSYNWYRRDTARRKFNSEFSLRGWPDFMFRAIGNTANDLADATLARVSIARWKEVGVARVSRSMGWNCTAESVRAEIRGFRKVAGDWLNSPHSPDSVSNGSVADGAAPKRSAEDQPLTLLGHSLGTLREWLGEPDAKAPILQSSQTVHCSDQRLLFCLQIGLFSAYVFDAGGYEEDAAAEFMQVAETVAWFATESHLESNQSAAVVLSGFSEIARFAIERAERLLARTRGTVLTGEYAVGATIPEALLATGLSLWRIAERYSLTNEPGFQHIISRVGVWMGCVGETFQLALKRAIDLHPFPVGVHLRLLAMAIEERGTTCDLRDYFGLVSQFRRDQMRFAAPLSFTPLQVGLALYRVLRTIEKDSDRDPALYAALRREIYGELHRGRAICAMRRDYYETIANMFYLYDDFNDRRVHFHFALLSAGYELAREIANGLHQPIKN